MNGANDVPSSSERRLQDLSPLDPTLDATNANTIRNSHTASRPEVCHGVALVQGSGPELTLETQSLLRLRLRAAALVLFTGSTLFLLWRLLVIGGDLAQDWRMITFQTIVSVTVGISALKLCRRCSLSMRMLRVMELLIFGLPAAYFATLLRFAVMHEAGIDRVATVEAAWLLLLFTYAIFIPNSLRRSAVIIGAIAATPVLLMTVLWFTHREAMVGITFEHFTRLVLIMSVAMMAGTYGSHMIGRLRREAFTAKQMGHYRLRHLLGAGGMGEVYLADHLLLKRPCAVKVIRPGKAGDPQVLARFEREVRATAKLSHWNSIEIFDFGSTDDGTFYYVMEYLPGLSLAELVDRFGPLPPERAIHLLAQTCDALSEAHRLGLIHRDIKPGNIFAAQRGGIYDVSKLLDFGLAKCQGKRDELHLTQEGSITGSPLFMSPEQATGDREPDARSDIYALGTVGYYLLTGKPPFDGETPMKVLVAHIRDEVTPPSRLRPDIPADLEQVLLKCLEKDPADRYQDAEALRNALQACELSGRWTRDRAARWWADNQQATPASTDYDVSQAESLIESSVSVAGA